MPKFICCKTTAYQLIAINPSHITYIEEESNNSVRVGIVAQSEKHICLNIDDFMTLVEDTEE